MAFFKKWKNNSKHRKLSEEWALASSLKDLSRPHDDLESTDGGGGAGDNDDDTIAINDDYDNDDNRSTTEKFNVKYLGCTIIDSARSEEATADAIKSIISTAKATRKKLQRVQLSISPKGIRMLDVATDTTLLQVSIYKISYCSADATHSDVFAFVGTADSDDDDKQQQNDPHQPQLMCYAFLCAKRKIAQKVTLTVAHSFEQAYQIWRDTTERRQYQLERLNRENHRRQLVAATTPSTDTHHQKHHQPSSEIRNLLIDFSSEITAEICGKDHRELLQNTWVSFDDAGDFGKSSASSASSAPVGGSGGGNNCAWETNKMTICS